MLAAVLGLGGSVAEAHDAPKLQVFAGYSYTRSDERNLHGWIGSAAYAASDRVGVVGELAGHYASAGGVDFSSLSFLAGPRFTLFDGDRLAPFVHVLAGGARSNASTEVLGVKISDPAMRLAAVTGAGLDLRIGGRLAIRIQGDYRFVRVRTPAARGAAASTELESDPRASAGLVYRFGRD